MVLTTQYTALTLYQEKTVEHLVHLLLLSVLNICIVSPIPRRVRSNYQQDRRRVSECPVNDPVTGIYKKRRATHGIPRIVALTAGLKVLVRVLN
jgi:hypothetical protein